MDRGLDEYLIGLIWYVFIEEKRRASTLVRYP